MVERTKLAAGAGAAGLLALALAGRGSSETPPDENEQPYADFDVSNDGLSISADASNSADPNNGQIVAYEWRLSTGNGVSVTTGAGETFSHAVSYAGEFTLELVVTDNDGATDSKTKTFGVAGPNDGPLAQFETTVDGLSLSADASLSDDPDGSLASYEWSLQRTSGNPVSYPIQGGETYSQTLDNAGTYELTLTVTDDRGGTDTASQTFDAEEPNVPPEVSFTTGTDGLVLSADAQAAVDPDGSIVAYDWALSDSGGGQIVTGKSPQFAYTVPSGGTYTLELVVTDNEGQTASESQNVDVVAPNEAPVAQFNSDTDGLTITADAGDAYDPDGLIVSYDWALQTSGDNIQTIADQTGQNFSTTVPSGGYYTLTLQVTDDRGAKRTVNQGFNVVEPNESPTANFAVSTDGLIISANGTGSTDPDGSIESYEWSLQRTSGTSVSYPIQSGRTFDQTADNPGTYELTLTVTDDRGATHTRAKTVTVEEPAPSLTVTDLYADGSAVVVESDIQYATEMEVIIYGGTNIPDGGTSYDVLTDTGWTRVAEYYSTGYSRSYDSLAVDFTVRNSDGQTDYQFESADFSDGGGGGGGGGGAGYESEIYVKNDANPTVAEQSINFTFEAAQAANVAGGSATNTADGAGQVEATLAPTDDMRIQYDGDISTLDWQGGCILVEDGNGERMDPFDMTTGGARRRWTGGTSEVFEVTIYQTEELWDMNGPMSPRILAEWLAGGLRTRGVSYDILHDLPVIRIPSESTKCYNPYWYDSQVCDPEDGCNSFDCCDPDDLLPAAYYWWDNARTGGTLHEQHNEETGANVQAPIGSTYVQRKDSNILLTGYGWGGCGSASPSTPQCVGPGKHIDRSLRFDATGFSVGLETDFISNIHDCLHEIGHNLGFRHPGPDGCDLGGGEGWIDDDGRWHRTPCIAHMGCENYCGTYVEDSDSPRRDRNRAAYKHPVYTECTIEYFMQEMGPEQGSIQPIAQTTAIGGEAPSCGCGLGEANGSTTARTVGRPAENDNLWG
jgi:hypothetical protein